jgi:hypothetical protein
MDIAKLSAPFAPDQVSWRLGSTTKDKTRGMALAYIDARDVMGRLDEVCGVDGWQCRYPHAGGMTVCEIGIKCGGEWIWKADGAGATDVEAEKGSLSDAFKRAAVRWGIGRYLYDLHSPWVELEAKGNSHVIKDSEYAKLRRLLGGVAQPEAPKVAPTPAVSLASLLAGIQEVANAEGSTVGTLKAWYVKNKAAVERLNEADRLALREGYEFALAALKAPDNVLMAG